MKQKTIIEKLSFQIGQNEIFVKREDLLPFSFGGNKARKAVEFFTEILANKNDVVATYGSSSSNHCRVIANMACKYGLPCYIICPEENYHKTLNSIMVEKFGAIVVKAPLDKIRETIDNLMAELSKNHKPYFIQGGGHGNLGTKAYVEAYEEIVEYEKENQIQFDYIFHASGTGTTQAGLICGAALNGQCDRKIVGISIARLCPKGKTVVEESVREYLDSVEYIGEVPKVVFDDSYVCEGYGKYNLQIVETVNEMIKKEGIPLNTTYTGKAFWGMKEYIESNRIQGKKILFINTGGAPLFFDDLGDVL